MSIQDRIEDYIVDHEFCHSKTFAAPQAMKTYKLMKDNTIVAKLTLSDGVLYNMYVAPDFRGKGYARQIVQHVLADNAQDLQDVRIEARAEEASTDLQKLAGFYQSLGFTITYKKPNRIGLTYAKPGEKFQKYLKLIILQCY